MSEHLTRVRILFRPETVILQQDPFAAGSNVVSMGEAKITERVFVGPFQRIRMEVARPEGIRPLVQDFGREETMDIEAIQPSDMTNMNAFQPGKVLWAGFKRYHILETSWPKLLLCQHEFYTTSAVPAVGCFLAHKARSQAVLFSVTDEAENVARVREKLEVIRQQFVDITANLSVRVRLGEIEDEILLEAQEGNYEMVILGRREKPVRAGTIRRILQQAQIPVLVVQKQIRTLSRFLICSAVGEPGKVDVRVGGRLARLVGASATVLHVGMPDGIDQRKRTERHLNESISTLETMGVEANTKIIQGEPADENILNESEAGNYDLIIIGAPQSTSRMFWQDAASEIVSRTKIPVLIVPMTPYD